ncbi:nitroreductase family protein [Arenibacter sp. M-2]|uniref:nitroreductase family protein n=1 Tax=Arenibacter sp. M-2 TaxID=3053612 RepID=UPI002570049B|nr:nitroreductase family protein [Arenibacter sp. M-2]MDL5513091.1 nitroreductase family protein [Arenibacter sp. M-2]|tara:strand:- start:71763 stop:72380 length:618 start_codon:yes stop_codon:yes gene_type:complete
MTAMEQIQLENIADCDYEIFALLKQRYSPRVFKDKKISEQHVHQLFEAVRWAASSQNQQPWRFLYAEKGSNAYAQILDNLTNSNKTWAKNAPLLILTAYKKETINGKENFYALHDLGLGLGAMTVQAQYMGIAMHHMAGLDYKKVQHTFSIPEEFHIATAIALGYYGGELEKLPPNLQDIEIKERQRMPQNQFAFKNCWETDQTK